MSKMVDLTGCRFNRLQVICRDGSYILNGKVKEPKWKCVCDCGNCVTVVDSYIAFRDWALSNGYSDDLTLDRIDLNGDYNSENCRWVTYKIQANNKSTNRLITVGDRTKTLSEWSDESGVPIGTLWSRINMYGWTAEEAIFTKVRGKRNE